MNHSTAGTASAVMQGAGWRVVDASACTAHENLREPIKGVIPGGIGMLLGDSNTGKTLVAIDWAFHLASGTSWAGRSTDCLPVVYFATEACVSVERRIVAISMERGASIPADKLLVVDVQPNLASRNEVDLIIAALKAMAPAGVVFFDTFANVSNGADENSVGEMSPILGSAALIHRETGWHVVFIHHTNKSGSMRGSSSIRGRLDFVIEVRATVGGAIEVSADKLRDGRKGHVATMTISTHKIGRDGYAEPLMAPVARVVNGVAPEATPKASTAAARRVEILCGLASGLAQSVGATHVEDSALREAFFAAIEGEVANDSKRKVYARTVEDALKAGVMLREGTRWRLPEPEAGQRDGTTKTGHVPPVPPGLVELGQAGQDGAPLGARPCPDVPTPARHESGPDETSLLQFELSKLRLDDVKPASAFH